MLLELNMGNWYNWILCILLLVGGIFLLVKCSDFFVGAASSIAKKLHVSPLIIGLTVVAFGTSCPELAVSVSDSISCLIDGGNANIAIGNVVGSNICNLLVVLGFSCLFTPIVVKKRTSRREFPILIFVSIICAIFGLCFNLKGQYAILRWEGAILVVLIIAYVAYLVIDAKRQIKLGTVNPDETDEVIEEMSTLKSIIFIVVGLAGIIAGGEAVVYGAKNIAYGIGDAAKLNHDLVESLVGLTVVAVGTSLPELVTSIVAAKKGQNEIALGNVIGSNIFNILFVLGIAGVVNPLTVGNGIRVDLAVMLASTLLVFGFALTGKIGKKAGFLLLACYAGYLVYLIINTVM